MNTYSRFFPIRLRFPRFPISIQFTRQGLIFVLLSLAIGAAAVNTGNNVLYLIFSLMLGLIIVSGMMSRRMLMGLAPSVEFAGQLFSGVSNVCCVTVSNRKRRLPSIGIRFALSDHSFPKTSRYFFYIPSNSRVSGFASILFPRRGVFHLNEMELQTRFPFAFFVKIRRYFLDQQVRIYPRVYRFSEEVLARFTEGMIVESPYRGESQQLLHLRDYSSFDSSKRIHWKASAKMERLLVKEYQKEQGRDLYLYFDCYPGNEEERKLMLQEKAISFLVSLAFLISERGFAGKIVFPDGSFDIGSGGQSLIPLLDYLVELKGEAPPAGRLFIPSESNVVSLQIRSKEIRPSLPAQGVSFRPLFVEDWAHLLTEDAGAYGVRPAPIL